jgi:RNA polymerase sigma-70 factor (family 1)
MIVSGDQKKGKHMDNETWIDRFKTGDEETLRDVYNTYRTRLYYYASKLVLNEQEAEEIVTDTFLKLWERHTNFSSIEKIESFIYKSTRNNCFDVIRRSKRKKLRDENLFYFYSKSVQELADHRLIQSQLMQIIDEEIEKLAPQCRQVFKMGYIEKKSNDEISKELNISINTVKTQKARALKHLRAALLKKDVFLLLVYLGLFESKN